MSAIQRMRPWTESSTFVWVLTWYWTRGAGELVGLLEADAGLDPPCMTILGTIKKRKRKSTEGGWKTEHRVWRDVGKPRVLAVGHRLTTDGAKSQKAMTTKGTPTVDSTGSLSLAQLPPQISLTSSVLASVIPLPPNPLIAYTIFEPSETLDPSLHLSAIESARRSLVSDSRSILKSLLFTVKLLPHPPLLYVFALSSSGQRSPPHDALLHLKFDGLACMFSSLPLIWSSPDWKNRHLPSSIPL